MRMPTQTSSSLGSTSAPPSVEPLALQTLRSRARGALLGLALGDALGATVEFLTPSEIRAAWGVHERIRGGGWLRLKPGQVTDDTTMAFALAGALLRYEDCSADDFARAFDDWMRAKPIDIGSTVRRGIVRFRHSGEPCVPPSADAGNGATMRCAPVALRLLGAPARCVEEVALDQARVTHHNPLTDAATRSVVAMIQAALAGQGIRGIMREAHGLVAAYPEFRFRTRPMLNPSGYIVDTMRALLQAMDVNDSFASALIDVVNRGGDADTTGAILGSIMGALSGIEGLPQAWLRALDACVYARAVGFADMLIERSPLWHQYQDEAASTVSSPPPPLRRYQ
jgi:ADP-ribosyl-[dinitrogen reductase] hydrolase